MLAESIMYNEQDLNYDFRIPERLYNFQHNNKQVFVENYSVNPVQLSARKRIGTISCVEPVINKESMNAWNASLGLSSDNLHSPVRDSNINKGVLDAIK